MVNPMKILIAVALLEIGIPIHLLSPKEGLIEIRGQSKAPLCESEAIAGYRKKQRCQAISFDDLPFQSKGDDLKPVRGIKAYAVF